MALSAGEWVDLGDGRIALISSWDVASGEAVAETPSGQTVDRSISFATARWQPVPESGLRVAAALDPARMRALADESPVEILILALNDLGGRGATADLRKLISPLVIADDDWEKWWRRTQTRLEDDDRIDASRSRDKIYAHARPGSSLGKSLVPAVQDGRRRDRRMADGPQLKRARDRAQQKGPPDLGDLALFEVELALAKDVTVDPTDRFLAAELGVWLERWTSEEARGTLGDDILAIDLLRIPAHASRTLALEWALERGGPGDSITYRSAMAAGSPWSLQARTALSEIPGALRQAAFGILGWSVPGDEDAGSAKLKDDLPTFERRVLGAQEMLPGLPADARIGLWEGTIHALRALPRSGGTYAPAIVRLRDTLARLAWASFATLDADVGRGLLRVDALRPMDGDGLPPLVRAAPTDALAQLRATLIKWYADDPPGQINNLRLLADLLQEDSLVLGMEAAQQIIRKTNLTRIALQQLHDASDAGRMDPLTSSVVNLAVAVTGDDPAVTKAQDRLAEVVVEGLVNGTAPVSGPITFSRSGWEAIGRLLDLRLDEATTNEAKAREEASTAVAEAARLRELAESRAQALAETKTSTGAESRQDVGRLASNLMKPVALAVADSFEANSLDSLQDRLLAVLQRAKIVPIHEVGDEVSFDPTRHQWVGDGSPTARVQARSPGFLIESEGGDDIVLVPARVVAAAAT